MNILFFTYDFPYPTNTGGKNRAFHLLKFAKSNDIKLYLFSFVRKDFSSDNVKYIEKIGVEKTFLFKRKTTKHVKVLLSVLNLFSSVFKHLYVEKHVKQELLKTIKEERIDIVHYESLYTAYYLSESIRKLGVRQLFGTENIEYLNYKDYATHVAPLLLKPFYLREAEKIKKEEEYLLKKSDVSLAVTKLEADIIKKITGKKSYVIENGVDLEYFSYKAREIKEQKSIVFVGNFTYFPNIDAIKYFYYEVFEKIHDIDIKLFVVGKNARKLTFLTDSRIELSEFVPDIRDIYSIADVFIFPVKFGGGTNFKVLEAMATGVPVVGFSDRIEQLGALDKTHYLKADGYDDFKEKILYLLTNQRLADTISKNARKLIEEKYSWEKIGGKLNKIWLAI